MNTLLSYETYLEWIQYAVPLFSSRYTYAEPLIMPKGKFFFIRHAISNLVLEVDLSRERPSSPVVLAYQIPITQSRDHQLWYVDPCTGTIRCKHNNHCIDLKDDKVLLNPYQRRNPHQRWVIKGTKIQSLDEADMVIGLLDINAQEGASVHSVDLSDGCETQLWDFDHTVAEYFYIRSQDNERVIEVAGGDITAGARAILNIAKNQMNDYQLWYEDESCVIRSKLTGYALTAGGHSGGVTQNLRDAAPIQIKALQSEDEVLMYPYEGQDRQQWAISGNTILNKRDQEDVLEFKGGGWFTSTYIVADHYTGSSSQLWNFDYIPSQIMSLSHPGIGQYVRIKSKLSDHYLSVPDGGIDPKALVILWDRKSELREANDQLWYIDEQSGTIRSALNDFCLDSNENDLVVMKPFSIESRTQQWKVNGMKIFLACNPDKCLRVHNNNEDLGAICSVTNFRAVAAHLWEVQNVQARCFYIKSCACDKILAVKNQCRDSGAQVAIYMRKPESCASQLWYEDENGIIRSKLNGYVLDSSDDNFIKLRPYQNGHKNQHWTIEEDTIQSKHTPNMVLDIRRGWTLEGTSVIAFEKHDKDNQRWYSEYL
jgi:hypothetical protein